MARARIAGKTLVACLSINMVGEGGREGGGGGSEGEVDFL